jgi:hypothetical protein
LLQRRDQNGRQFAGLSSPPEARKTAVVRVRAVLLAVLVLALFPVAASANYAHVVQPAETLTSIAAADGLSVDALARANGISLSAELIAGKTLWIPPRTAANAALGATAKHSYSAQVTTGSLASTSATAPIEGTDADEDGDTDSSTPTTRQASSTTTTTQAAATTTHASTTSSHAGSTSGGPIPTLERVDSSQIAAVAAANGVPAALAEAIAWQESGWNNDELSSVGAVGVMQIVPTTWSWVDAYLTPSDPLGTASATENVRAGVLLLHQLLQITGGNEQLAVAGYFQGLASVRRFGLYASTRRYVADVLALADHFGA